MSPVAGAFVEAATFGKLGVPLFFVISGFCVHLQWARGYASTGIMPRLSFVKFWRRRLLRLYPPYFVALCGSMLIVFAAWRMHLNVPLVALYPDPKPAWMAADFAAHATMLHGLIPMFDLAGGNQPFWTLAREEYFYLLYLPLLPFRRAFGLRATVVSVLVLGLALRCALPFWMQGSSPAWTTVSRSPLILWFQWCLGMAAVEAYYGLASLPRIFRAPWAVVLWLAIAAAGENVPALTQIGWGLAFFAVVNCAVDIEKSGRWPVSRLFRWLAGTGVASYSIYLAHNPIRSILKVAISPMVEGRSMPIFALSVALLVLAGYWGGRAFFWLVERHFLTTPARSLAQLPPRPIDR